MATTLYASKYLCLNILSTDVKDGQIHLENPIEDFKS